MRGRRRRQTGLIGVAVVALGIAACGHDHGRESAPPAPRAGEPGLSQRWENLCGRCHNLKPPSSYTAEQWRVTISHMRLRAYLTGEEKRAMIAYLAPAVSVTADAEEPR